MNTSSPNTHTAEYPERLRMLSDYPITKHDVQFLFLSQMVYADADGRLRWNHAEYPEYCGAFVGVRHLCDAGRLLVCATDDEGATSSEVGKFAAEWTRQAMSALLSDQGHARRNVVPEAGDTDETGDWPHNAE